ncbi:hypothetical protein [Alkaliphilus transvaalensis]|uniref:hypothetical protein n=1 Tax=Alkaliphilus transvaalensis TaxID=114628 RepID=UPI00047C1C02|nr:hypothetical protein [Alkaliphilus transvaalensis]
MSKNHNEKKETNKIKQPQEKKITLETIRERANALISDEIDIDKLYKVVEKIEKEKDKKDQD